jgi:RNA ligase (TIGR02306 family)
MRKLASIQKIKSVEPIIHPVDGTLTSIELIRFEDIAWQCVAKKGEFSVGDFAVYIEISSIVPDHPVFEFLRARKFKVKTIRLLGVLSQGLALPVDILGEFDPIYLEFDTATAEWNSGADVTDVIGVTRYEPPVDYKITGSGKVRPFPTDIVPKTDEIRVQSAPFILQLFEGMDISATLKYDGTSCTVFWDMEEERLRVCSRNMEKMEDDGSVYFLALKNNPRIEEFCRENPNLILQGEVVSPGVQKNRLAVDKPTFYAFNLWNRAESNYMPLFYASAMAESYGIPWVETVYRWKEFTNVTIDDLLEIAEGFYPQTNNPREGIVLRPTFEERYHYLLGGRLSAKVISNSYLLAGGE